LSPTFLGETYSAQSSTSISALICADGANAFRGSHPSNDQLATRSSERPISSMDANSAPGTT